MNIQKWEKRRKQETGESSALQGKIDQEWEKALALKNPFELHSALATQKQACDSLIEMKNKLINEYMAELKIKDDAYVKELKRQSEEIGNYF